MNFINNFNFYFKIFLVQFLLAACATKHSSIEKITQYSEIPKELIDHKSLVLLDIDNTILRAESHYGSVEHFEYLTAQEMQLNNLSAKQTKLKLISDWEKAQLVVKTKLIDPNVYSFIEYADAYSDVIGFIARPPHIKELTFNQLDKHKIYLSTLPGFSFTKIYKQQIFPDEEWCNRNKNACEQNINKQFHLAKAEFYKGIIFANDINSKGEVFIDFYKEFSDYIYNTLLVSPKRIIFVDDKMSNLLSMQESAKKSKINFYGYLIESKFTFDPMIAEKEAIQLNKK